MSFRRASVLFLVLGGAVGCTAYPTTTKLALDCTADSAYDLMPVDTFETVGTANFWTAGDTPEASVGVTVDMMEDGARCNSMAAAVLRSFHNNDWGLLFGYNNFARDASGYEGMAFWARAPGSTTKAFTMLLDDANTSNPMTDTLGPPNHIDGNCRNYQGADGGAGATPLYDSTGMPISGATTSAPPPDSCGNSYSVVVVVTTDWRFYTVPFGMFQQGRMPNRVPNAQLIETGPVAGTALLTAKLKNLTFRMPKEADMELWIDNLSLYRKKAAGGDGGADAPRM